MDYYNKLSLQSRGHHMQRVRTEEEGIRNLNQQFQTFRNQDGKVEEDEEMEELMDRVRELEEEIKMVKERSRHLEQCNNTLNHIIVSYHTKSSSRFENFMQKVNAICDKRTERTDRTEQGRSHERRSSQKSSGLARKSNSSHKQLSTLTNYDPTTFGKTKGQFSSINDQNNSYLSNTSNLITRQDVKKKLASKATPNHHK